MNRFLPLLGLLTVCATLSCTTDSSVQLPAYLMLKEALRSGEKEAIREVLGNSTLDEFKVEGIGLTAYAVAIGDSGMIALLGTAGANMNYVDPERGTTPLHFAVALRSIQSVKALLAAGADANVTDSNDGRTPMHVAAQIDSLPMIELLALSGGLHSIKDRAGMTPLHVASERLSACAVLGLLSFNADRLVRDGSGKTPYQLVPKGANSHKKELANLVKSLLVASTKSN